jgi:hypothetical protein
VFTSVFLVAVACCRSAGKPASLQAVQFLKQTLGALGATSPITDITLSGTAHYIAGSDDETGTATLKAIPGASRVDLNLSEKIQVVPKIRLLKGNPARKGFLAKEQFNSLVSFLPIISNP